MINNILIKLKTDVFYRKLLLTVVFIVLFFQIFDFFTFGIDPQTFKSSNYSYFIINKLQKTIVKGKDYALVGDFNLSIHKKGETIIKVARGLPGDHIVVKNGYVSINNGKKEKLWLFKTLKKYFKNKQKLSDYDMDIVLKPGQLWMMGTTIYSYDSRYHGPFKKSQIIGRAYPVDI